MVSLFFSPLLLSSDATSEDTWTTSADYKAAYTGSWLPCQKQPLIQSQFGHPYSPVTMPCWADLKVANMSGHKKNTKNTNPSWDIYTHGNNSEQKKCHSTGFCPVFNQSTGFRKDVFHNKRRKVRTLTEQPILENRKHYYSQMQSVETKNEYKNQLWKSD